MRYSNISIFVRVVIVATTTLFGFACGDSSDKKTASSDTDSSGDPTYNDSDTTGASEFPVGDTSANGTVLTEENATLCDVTCDQLKTCDADEFSDCAAECTTMALALRQTVLDDMTDCISLQDCATLSPDTCMADAVRNVPDSVVDKMVDGICQKMSSCGDSTPLETCKQTMTDGEGDMTFLKVFNDNVIDCFGACITTKTCQELGAEGDALLEDCIVACDADIGGNDDSQDSGEHCAAFAGDWQTESISCSGTDLPLGDMSIEQTIHGDCTMEMTVTNEECVIAYSGTYDIATGNPTLGVTTTCGGGCDENSCNNTSGVPTTIEISLTPNEGNLTMAYNVTPEVVAANMSPCSQGSLHIAVMGAK